MAVSFTFQLLYHQRKFRSHQRYSRLHGPCSRWRRWSGNTCVPTTSWAPLHWFCYTYLTKVYLLHRLHLHITQLWRYLVLEATRTDWSRIVNIYLLGCDAEWICRWPSTFRRNILRISPALWPVRNCIQHKWNNAVLYLQNTGRLKSPKNYQYKLRYQYNRTVSTGKHYNSTNSNSSFISFVTQAMWLKMSTVTCKTQRSQPRIS